MRVVGMIKIQIIGTQVACKEGLKDTWRDVAAFAKSQLQLHFKDEVEINYYDLFDRQCPTFPKEAQIPIVMVDDELFSAGGKIDIPKLKNYLKNKLI